MSVTHTGGAPPRIFENIRNGPIGLLRAWGKLIHEKNQKSKISWHCPFKGAVEANVSSQEDTKIIWMGVLRNQLWTSQGGEGAKNALGVTENFWCDRGGALFSQNLYRRRIHERTIPLRFLDVILRVLRFSSFFSFTVSSSWTVEIVRGCVSLIKAKL